MRALALLAVVALLVAAGWALNDAIQGAPRTAVEPIILLEPPSPENIEKVRANDPGTPDRSGPGGSPSDDEADPGGGGSTGGPGGGGSTGGPGGGGSSDGPGGAAPAPPPPARPAGDDDDDVPGGVATDDGGGDD
jgi:uncharacterized membrane protein YgcG